MNGFSRDKLFQEFHKQTGIKPFSPEFIDSMVAVMRDADSCLSERVFAWSKWRSWGNSSRFAVSDWDPAIAWRLDQTDCALDLAWFQEGRTLEWVVGMPREYRLKMRDRSHPDRPKVKDRARISEAFTKNADRGTITSDGQEIVPAVSPQQNTLQKFAARATFEKDPTFLEAWKIADATNFEQWRSSCAAYNRAKKVARAAYRAYRKHATSAAAIIIDVKASPKNPNSLEADHPPHPVLSATERADDDEAPPLTPEVLPAIRADFATFKALYPKTRFDEGKAKPIFEGLKPEQKARVIAQLARYKESARWQDQAGRWIPFASNWLPVYEADPPDAFRPANGKTEKVKSELETTMAVSRFFSAGRGGGK